MKRWMTALAVCAALAVPALASAEVVAIKGATVHTVSGEVIEDGVVVLGEDGRIEAVGGPSVTIPAGARVVDAAGKVVTPGLVDAHTQLGLVEIWAVKATRDSSGAGGPVRASYLAVDGYNPGSAVIPVQRAGGITDAVVVPSGGVVSGMAGWTVLADHDSEHLEGEVVADEVALVVTMGASGAGAAGGSRGALAGMLGELFEDALFFAKNAQAFDQGRSRALSASAASLRALGRVMGGSGPAVMFEANRISDIRAALRLSEKYELRPVIVGGLQAWKIADELAKAKVPVVLDPTKNLPARFESIGARADAAALLEAAGVPVILTTYEAHNVRRLRQLAGNAVREGMTHAGALRAITLGPAEALGQGKDRGSLEAGKVANVVIWSGDPFEMSTKVEAMFIGGEEVAPGDRQVELFERYRELERRAEPADQPEREEKGSDG